MLSFKMKAWLKGGLIFGAIDLIFVFLVLFTPLMALLVPIPVSAKILWLEIVQIPFSFLLYLADIKTYNSGGVSGSTSFVASKGGNIFVLVVGGLIIYLLIGALIGWIVGKIRNRE